MIEKKVKKMVKDVISSKKEITLGDKVFYIKPISLLALADYQEWCLSKINEDKEKEKTKKIKDLIDIYKLAGQEPNVDKIIDITSQENEKDAETILTEGDSLNLLSTIDGMCYLIKTDINENNDKQVDLDFVKKNFDFDDTAEIAEFIMHEYLTKIEEAEEKDKPVKNQKTKSPSKK